MGQSFELNLGLDFTALQQMLAQAKGEVASFIANAKTASGQIWQGAETSTQSWSGQLEEARQKLDDLANRARSFFSDASGLAAKEAGIGARFKREFGDGAAAAEEYAERTSSAFARGKDEIEAHLTQLSYVAKNMGYTRDAGQALSKQLLEMGYDFAAARGLDAAQAFDAMQAALVGNVRALRQYGIVINDAAEKEEALKRGLDPAALTAQQESEIRLAIVTNALADSKGVAAKAAQGMGGAFRTLSNETEELKVKIGAAYNESIAPFVKWAASAVKSIREWAEAHPQLTQAIVGTAASAGVLLGGFAALSKTVSVGGLVLTEFANGLRFVKFAANETATGISGLYSQLASGTPVAMNASTALVGIGVAIAGWKVGEQLREWLELEAAVDRVAHGVGSQMDKFKADVIDAIGEVSGLNTIWDIFDGKIDKKSDPMLERKKEIEELGKQFEIGSKAAQDYNRLTKEGMAPQHAANVALDEEVQLLYLLKKGNAATLDDKVRLAELELRHADATQRFSEQIKVAAEKAISYDDAMKRLISTKPAAEKALDEINRALAKQAGGSAVVDAIGIREQAKPQLDMLKQRGDAELAVLAALKKKRMELEQGGAGGGQEYSANERAFDAHLAALKKANDDYASALAAVNEKIQALEAEHTEALRTEAQKRIDAVRHETDEVVKELQRQVSEVGRELKQLQQLDQDATAQTVALAKKFEDATQRARNSRVADINAIREERDAKLQLGGSQEAMNRLISASDAELRRAADSSKERTALLQKEAEAQRALKEARANKKRAHDDVETAKARQGDENAPDMDVVNEKAAASDEAFNAALETRKAIGKEIVEFNRLDAESQAALGQAIQSRDQAESNGIKTREDHAARINQAKADELELNGQIREAVGRVAASESEITKELQRQTDLLHDQLTTINSIQQLREQQTGGAANQPGFDKDTFDFQKFNEEWARRKGLNVSDNSEAVPTYANAVPSIDLPTVNNGAGAAQGEFGKTLEDYANANMDAMADVRSGLARQGALLKSMAEKMRGMDIAAAARVDLAGTGLSDIG